MKNNYSSPFDTLYLFERRIAELEKEFTKTKKTVKKLRKKLENDPDSLDKIHLKSHADLLTLQIRLLKEQTTFYVKLGEAYDVGKVLLQLVDELQKESPLLCAKIIDRVNDRLTQAGYPKPKYVAGSFTQPDIASNLSNDGLDEDDLVDDLP